MKKLRNILVAAGLVVFASSCTMNSKSVASSSLNTQVNLTMGDLEYVGEVTGSATQYYALGLPIGGRRYYTASTGGLAIPGAGLVNRGMSNALYDALMQKPDADFVLPLSMESKKNVMFLGRKEMITVRAKAFRIKTK